MVAQVICGITFLSLGGVIHILDHGRWIPIDQLQVDTQHKPHRGFAK